MKYLKTSISVMAAILMIVGCSEKIAEPVEIDTTGKYNTMEIDGKEHRVPVAAGIL